MIRIVFTNGTQSVELKHVRSVEWQSELADDVLVNKTTRAGKRILTYTINGFIIKGIPHKNVEAQKQLEADLTAVGAGRLEWTGNTDVTQLRFSGIEFSEFRGNPVCPFKIKFKSEETSIHAHYPIKIGDLTLAPTYGYEHASVKDSIGTQGPDERLGAATKRTFTIQGTIVDATLDGINEKQQAIINKIKDVDDLVLTLSSDSGDYSAAYTVRPRKVDFSAPRLRGEMAAREFTLEFATHDDYTKEPYTLGESAASFAGISIDVVDSFDHDKQFEHPGTGATAYSIIDESVSVSGKKYFVSYAAYTTFRDLFESIPFNTYLFTSDTANVLELTDITVGKFERDGNSADTEKRYSCSVSLNFKWQKTIQQQNYSALTTYFGVAFYKVPSINFSATVDSSGNITSRSISLNGEIKTVGVLNTFKGLVGTAITFDATYSGLYVTSANVSGVDTYNDNGTQVTVYKVSLSAAQLDKASQAVNFIRSLFKMEHGGGAGTSYSADTIQFENVTNLTKSISNRWDQQTLKFIATQITITISGDVFDPDNGSGKPANPNKLIILFNKLDALLNAGKSTQSAVNSVTVGELLPTNSDIHYFLNSFNIGQWQPAIAPENLQGTNGAIGSRYWKQNVSISATAVFDLTGSSNNQPDSVESRSIDIALEVPKFTQLQVAGFGTVFKRVGTTPEKATVTHQKQFRDARVYVPNDYGFGNAQPSPTGWIGLGRSILTKENKENRGLANRWTVEYEANEKLH